MRFEDICKAIESGSMTLEFAGHSVNCDKDEILRLYKDTLEVSKGSNDGKWNRTSNETQSVEQVNKEMRKHYQRILDAEIKDGGLVFDITNSYCFGCGKELRWMLTGNQLQLRAYHDRSGHGFALFPPSHRCEFEQPQPTTGTIKVTSDLVFANFFAESRDADDRWQDSLKKDRYTNDWSLNSFAGRKRITEYKAKNNIAFGQMGNMSIGVYVNKAKDSIIIGPEYHPAELGEFDSDKEYEEARKQPFLEGYRKMGNISLSVWRWEATDKNTIGKELLHKLKNEYHKDVVVVKAAHGDWKFEHFYDTLRSTDDFRKGSDPKNYIYSKLDLVK